MISLVLLKLIFYFWPFLRAFLGLFFIFSRLLKQIQVSWGGLILRWVREDSAEDFFLESVVFCLTW